MSAQNYFNAIQTPNTYENRNFVYSNRRIFTIIFSAQNRQTNKNIPPLPENNGTLKLKSVSTFTVMVRLVRGDWGDFQGELGSRKGAII